MKRSVLLLTALFAVVLFAGTAFAAITGSKHDLGSTTGAGAKGTQEEICVYCHTPHNAPTAVPLWNRAAPVGPYTVYTSGTLDGTATATAAQSVGCLSCHDGVGTLSNVTNANATRTAVAAGGVVADKIASGAALIGTSLTNDHPIGIVGGVASADAGIKAPVNTVLYGGASATVGNVECASCHNPHDNTIAPFLRTSNASSAMCLDCHIK